MWGPRLFHHEYTFTKTQRLEKYKRLETGLDWRGRLLALSLKPVKVVVEKILTCPCCLEPVDVESGHSCGNPEELGILESEDAEGDEEVSRSNDGDTQNTCQVSSKESVSRNGFHKLRNSYSFSVHNENDTEIISASRVCRSCGLDCDGDCYNIEPKRNLREIITNNDIIIEELKNDRCNSQHQATPVLVFSKMSSPKNVSNASNTVLVKTCSDDTTITLPRKTSPQTPQTFKKFKPNDNLKNQTVENVRVTPLGPGVTAAATPALVLAPNRNTPNRSIAARPSEPSEDIVIVQEVLSNIRGPAKIQLNPVQPPTLVQKPKNTLSDKHYRIQQRY